jgi:hypothetical protein
MNDKGYLLSNEADGRVDNYDLYDTDGNLLKEDYINAAAHSGGTTGIAFDGTNFYTSNIFQGSLNEWTEGGTFIKTISLTGAGASTPFLIEDLSADYSQVLGGGGGPGVTPEPSTFILLGTGLTGFAGLMRRKFAR